MPLYPCEETKAKKKFVDIVTLSVFSVETSKFGAKLCVFDAIDSVSIPQS